MPVLHSAHLSNHKSPRFVIPFLFTSDCRGLALPLSKPFFFTGFSQHPPPLLPSLLIDVTAYPQIQHRQNTKPIHPTGFLLHHTQPERVFFLLIPDDTLIQYPQFFPLLLFFSYEKPIFTPRDCLETLLSFYLSCLSLLCIHAAIQIQHIQTSGL